MDCSYTSQKPDNRVSVTTPGEAMLFFCQFHADTHTKHCNPRVTVVHKAKYKL